MCCEHFMVFLFEICQKAVNDFGIIISQASPRMRAQCQQNGFFFFLSVLVTRGVYDSCEVFEITITKYIIKSKTRLGLCDQ